MSGEPKTLTPQAMTLEEGLAAIFPDTIGRRDDGKWPFFTYVNDEHGHTCTAIFDSWPEAVSWAKFTPVVARDEAAELRAAVREFFKAEDAVAALHEPNGTYTDFHAAADIANAARETLRRLASGENEK